MAQGSKTAQPSARNDKQSRTTVILPETLNFNLDFLALRSRKPKGELIREALTEYLQRQGLTPERVPLIEISY